MNRAYTLGVLQVALSAMSWGTWSLFLRPSGLPVALSSLILFIVMAVVSLALASRDAIAPQWDARVWGLLIAHGLCDALNVMTFFQAMEHTSIALAVLAHYLAPLWVALAAPWLGEPRVPRASLFALLGLLGLALVLEPWHAQSWPAGTLLGVGLAAISAFAYAANIFFATAISKRIGPARSQGYHCAIAAIALVPYALTTGAVTFDARGLGIMLIGAVFPGAIAGWFFVRGLRVVGSSTASMLTFLEPIVAVAVGVFFWHERMSLLGIVGMLCVIAAGALAVFAQKPTASTAEPGSVV